MTFGCRPTATLNEAESHFQLVEDVVIAMGAAKCGDKYGLQREWFGEHIKDLAKHMWLNAHPRNGRSIFLKIGGFQSNWIVDH